MGFKLKNLIPIAAGLAANTFLPGSGALVGGLASGLVGGSKSNKNAKAQQQQYIDALRANRPTQTTPWGTSAWSQDDKGNWSQNVSLNPEDQKRLELYRQIAAARMGAASGMTLPTGKIDYNKMGLGHIASAAGIGEGTTGKRPWADSPYASMGGNLLRELQYPQSSSGGAGWMSMIQGGTPGMAQGGGGGLLSSLIAQNSMPTRTIPAPPMIGIQGGGRVLP